MKTFQKITLAAAISAAPFMAQAELTPMDDALMGDTTGQAGVTVEISINAGSAITIEEVTYTDTASTDLVNGDRLLDETDDNIVNPLATFDGGSVAMQNISISGISKLIQTIDVSDEGDLLMTMKGEDALFNKTLAADGSVTDSAVSAGNGVSGVVVSLGGTANSSAVLLQGATSGEAELVNNLSINADLGESTTTIYNLSNHGGLVSAAGATSTATAAMAIGMTSSFRLNDLDAGIFGYTKDQTDVSYGVAAAKNTLETAPALAGNLTFNADGVAASDDVADNALVATYNAVVGTSNAAAATGAAIGIENMSFMGADGGMVTVEQTIWADATGVSIEMGQIAGTINIGSVSIGGASIGSVSIANLNLAGMTQKIYGH